MTEQRWLACTDPQPMLEFLAEKSNERRLRLFAVACCRRVWHLLSNSVCQNAIDVAERQADGLATEQELEAAHIRSFEAMSHDYMIARKKENAGILKSLHYAILFATTPSTTFLSPQSIEYSFGASYLYGIAGDEAVSSVEDWRTAWDTDRRDQCSLIYEIFGNPFLPVTPNPTWLTLTVQNLAVAIYDEQAFDRLPILADALEDAGCGNEDLLSHCRQAGEHVHGCWALDLVLGKE